jgi:hypothetical protein
VGKGQEQPGGASLEELLERIGEEVEERALVTYRRDEPGAAPFWGLLLLTPTAMHVIYGEHQHWLDRVVRRGPATHHLITVPYDTVVKVELPPPGNFVQRLLRGPTRPATVRRRDGDSFVLELDRDAARLVETLRRRSRTDQADPAG